MGFIFWILIGGVAGWIAERVTNSNHSLLTNILVGVVGAFIGGWVFTFLGLQVGAGIAPSLVTAVVGALILLFGLKFIKGRG
ncbi:MAG: GlsB/YeaQ/YmgE family stress response membrane protein [Rhizobiales bacterium]|nr:GlsB/YeaQ/YmgE family stress response membrane protein [Hyphomicrobiales bacterium]